MHILAGLDKPTSGEVAIAGTAISKLNDTELTLLRREHIGFIFQFFNLLPMLNAEENVVLPLSLAGEKPDKEWVAELIAKIGLEDRSKHRPVGALRRPAAAGRDRPGAGQPADDRLRRRADRQPRLEDERRDPRAHARFRRRVRPDHRDGHARPARGDDRGPDPLPRRRLDRSRPRPLERSEVIAVMQRSSHDDRASPSKACSGASSAPLLTALAIVLGVAMISGTYVLTDTITAAFTTSSTTRSENSDAVISGKVAFKNDNSNTAETPAFPASVLVKVRQLPDVADGCRGGRRRGTADRTRRQGHLDRGRRELGSSVDPPNDARFNPLKLAEGRWPVGGGQIAIDKHTAERSTTRSATRSALPPTRAHDGSRSPESRRTPSARRSAPPRSRSSTSPPRRSCSRRSASSTGSSSRRRTG